MKSAGSTGFPPEKLDTIRLLLPVTPNRALSNKVPAWPDSLLASLLSCTLTWRTILQAALLTFSTSSQPASLRLITTRCVWFHKGFLLLQPLISGTRLRPSPFFGLCSFSARRLPGHTSQTHGVKHRPRQVAQLGHELHINGLSVAASWHSRSTPARPDQKHHRVLLHAPHGAPCYPTNPARRCSMPPTPCTLAAAGAHEIVHFHSQPSRQTPTCGICKGSDGCWKGSTWHDGLHRSPAGREFQEWRIRRSVLLRAQDWRRRTLALPTQGAACQVLSFWTRVSGSSTVNSAQFLAMASQAPRVFCALKHVTGCRSSLKN